MLAFLSHPARRANFFWDAEADEASQALKSYLACLLKIASLLPGETFLLYLVVSEQGVSMVLVVERAKEQIPNLVRKPRLGRGRSKLSLNREVCLCAGDD